MPLCLVPQESSHILVLLAYRFLDFVAQEWQYMLVPFAQGGPHTCRLVPCCTGIAANADLLLISFQLTCTRWLTIVKEYYLTRICFCTILRKHTQHHMLVLRTYTCHRGTDVCIKGRHYLNYNCNFVETICALHAPVQAILITLKLKYKSNNRTVSSQLTG